MICLCTAQRLRSKRTRRQGFTLTELLISVALSLILVMVMVQVFGLLGNSLRQSRALIDMSNQLGTVTNRLQKDLSGLTLEVRPWISSSANAGYFELYEGLGRDGDLDANGIFFEAQENSPALRDAAPPYNDVPAPTGTLYGDVDDILMFTSRSDDEPFVGRVSDEILGISAPAGSPGYTLIESNVAEIAWWVQRDGQGNIRLFRRALLVVPELARQAGVAQRLPSIPFATPDAERQFYRRNDLSVRPGPNGQGIRLNSLGDLTLRENRFAHTRKNVVQGNQSVYYSQTFPYRLWRRLLPMETSDPVSNQVEYGPVVLTDVLAFDVKVYDPQAPLDMSKPVPLTPSDPGYAPVWPFAATGAFVDLGFGTRIPASSIPANSGWSGSHFSGPPMAKSQLAPANAIVPGGTYPAYVYCTWPEDYERDGLDQNRNGMTDEGRNGVDDDGVGGVDDPGEWETAPPYPYPLRGIEVTIRMLDPDTKQLRQVSVVSDFLPDS